MKKKFFFFTVIIAILLIQIISLTRSIDLEYLGKNTQYKKNEIIIGPNSNYVIDVNKEELIEYMIDINVQFNETENVFFYKIKMFENDVNEKILKNLTDDLSSMTYMEKIEKFKIESFSFLIENKNINKSISVEYMVKIFQKITFYPEEKIEKKIELDSSRNLINLEYIPLNNENISVYFKLGNSSTILTSDLLEKNKMNEITDFGDVKTLTLIIKNNEIHNATIYLLLEIINEANLIINEMGQEISAMTGIFLISISVILALFALYEIITKKGFFNPEKANWEVDNQKANQIFLKSITVISTIIIILLLFSNTLILFNGYKPSHNFISNEPSILAPIVNYIYLICLLLCVLLISKHKRIEYLIGFLLSFSFSLLITIALGKAFYKSGIPILKSVALSYMFVIFVILMILIGSLVFVIIRKFLDFVEKISKMTAFPPILLILTVLFALEGFFIEFMGKSFLFSI